MRRYLLISDPEISRAAKLLVEQYGQDAGSRANERVAALLKHGDTESALIWRRIVAAIEELRRGRRVEEPIN
jgi:hypothetical protein